MSLSTTAPPMLSEATTTPTQVRTPTQSPQQTENSNHGSSKSPSTSSLLFGFLISFLALFVVFMACGLGSRYLVDRRRRLRQASNHLHVRSRRAYKPVLWNVWAIPGHEKWKDMVPLSAEVRMRPPSPHPGSLNPGEHSPSEQLTHLYRGFGRGGLAFAPLPHLAVPSSSRLSRTRITEEAVDLQISVLIAMPSSASTVRHRTSILKGKDPSLHGQKHTPGESIVPDVAVGVATIPWDKERMDFG